MSEDRMGRRDALQQLFALGGMLLIPATALACNKSTAGLSCNNTNGMAEADLTVRKSLEYTDVSSDPDKKCQACQLFQPAGENKCGGCTAVKGPINPRGSCKAFAKKA